MSVPPDHGYHGLFRAPDDPGLTLSDRLPYHTQDGEEPLPRVERTPFRQTSTYRAIRILVLVAGAYTLISAGLRFVGAAL